MCRDRVTGTYQSPAIGCMVADIIKEKLHPEVNPDFDPVRKGILDPSELSLEERNELIKRSRNMEISSADVR